MLYNYTVGHSMMYFVSQNKTFQYFKPSLGIKNLKTHRLQDEGTTRLKMQIDFWVLGLIAAALYEKNQRIRLLYSSLGSMFGLYEISNQSLRQFKR